MLYQRKILPYENWGYPAELPEDLVRLNLDDKALADLSTFLDTKLCDQLGYVGQGFFPHPDPLPDIPTDIQAQAVVTLKESGLWDAMIQASISLDEAANLFVIASGKS